ncbi:hypothetical protein KCO_08710 [Pectobacterium brasiliense ICMP 19477]|uniref:Uncharacterized protein n=1 Tax=Pectobacterium brasiliense TaxID=180957 RepID=M4GXJ4_9GAMM|nr:hypothetical protein KCO_08710 [Pectobacterium brasiliense]KMK84141.1 hypothetical protein KCO_08710 [Pectobacterium brasiliense ICMP 19477]
MATWERLLRPKQQALRIVVREATFAEQVMPQVPEAMQL